MKSKLVNEINTNQEYLIGKRIKNLDFIDHYQLTTKKLNFTPEPKDLMIAFFKSFPKSFRILLSIRESIAKLINLKTAPKTEKESRIKKLHKFKGEIGDSIAVFEVLDKSEKELLTGQTDSHLDFKLSFITYKQQDAINLELATTVIIKNTLGKIYFSLVKPIHKIYMKRILKKMELELINKCW